MPAEPDDFPDPDRIPTRPGPHVGEAPAPRTIETVNAELLDELVTLRRQQAQIVDRVTLLESRPAPTTRKPWRRYARTAIGSISVAGLGTIAWLVIEALNARAVAAERLADLFSDVDALKVTVAALQSAVDKLIGAIGAIAKFLPGGST